MNWADTIHEPLSQSTSAWLSWIWAGMLALSILYVFLHAWSGPVVCSRCESHVRRKLGIPPETPSGGLCRDCRRWYRDNLDRIIMEARDDT